MIFVCMHMCNVLTHSCAFGIPSVQIGVAKDIIAKDGFGSLYRGLSAGLLRQATYTTARLGIFNTIR
jgi:hypothetical protein